MTAAVTSIVFTAEQMAALRAALGVPPGSPDPDSDDLVVVLAAEGVAAAEARRWDGLGP